MNTKDINKELDRIILKAWSDEEFKAKLLANPKETMREEGIEIPTGVKVNVLENTEEVINLVIPVKREELSDDDLDGIAGGRPPGRAPRW